MKKTEGITLIGLIITIIIILILVAVVIQLMINSGLFTRAQEATKSWNDAQIDEQRWGAGDFEIEIGNKKYNSIDEYIGTNNKDPELDRSYIQVGDYIQYEPDSASEYSISETISGYSDTQHIAQDTTLTWRVMNINTDGSVDLISSTPIATSVHLNGALGYSNGVYILNDLCREQYSNTELGAIARSVNIEDIEKQFSDTGNSAKISYINEQVANLNAEINITKVNSTNNTVTYSKEKSYYPDIYQHEKGAGINTTEIQTDGIAESGEYSGYENGTTTNISETADENGLTVTYTYYKFDNISTSYFKNTKFYEVMFGTGKAYWLASRGVVCNEYCASFNLRLISGSHLYGYQLFGSDGEPKTRTLLVRPVVTLGPNIKISTEGGTTAESPRTISL